MALNLEVPQLKSDLDQSHARWIAEVTPLSHLSEDEKRLRLGAVPPSGTPSLIEREETALANLDAFFAIAPAAPAYPRVFDWWNVNGQNFITPVRDQSSCGSCVAFGSIAAVEVLCRITSHNPTLNVDLSEAQLFYCHARSEGRRCSGANGGWWPDRALVFLQNLGVADEACYPYTPGDQNCSNLCPDWQAQVTRITGWHRITKHLDMKQWIATRGPLITCFTVYDDFYSYKSGEYHHVSGDISGGHCVCVVGYDDGAQCWICKNSWGSGWGDHGFFRIVYGQCGIDAEMYAVEGVVSNSLILADTAVAGPALANLNDQILAIAWMGTDRSHHLNVANSTDGGHTFSGKVILAETSFDGPALAFGNGNVFLSWVGTNSAHYLNVIQSTNCRSFTNKVVLEDTSRFGPALAYGNGRLFLVWVGTDSNRRLNVMSSTDGVTWGNKVTLNESSDSAPAACIANNRLYITWQGTDSNSSINFLESTDGQSFSNKVTISESSDFHPALISDHLNDLVLVWTGRDSNHHLNGMHSYGGATSAFTNKIVMSDTSIAGPAIVTYVGLTLIAWTGTDGEHHLNVELAPHQ